MRPVIQRVLLLLLLVMAVVLIFGAIINYFTSSEKSQPDQNETSTGQSTQGATGANPSQPVTVQQPTPSASSTVTNTAPASGAAANTSAATSTATGKNSAELADSGPGSTAAIFAVASLIGYMIYRRALLRRSLN